MSTIQPAPTPVNSGTDPAATQTPVRSLGYPFDPIPREARALLEQGRIPPIDYVVLGELLSFRRAFRDSCWVSKAVLAKRLGITTRTVQRSLRRLGEAGLIRQDWVAVPDPDEERNRTGWRIFFLFIDPHRGPLGAQPDRRSPVERCKHPPSLPVPPDNCPGEDTAVSPDSCPGEDTAVSQVVIVIVGEEKLDPLPESPPSTPGLQEPGEEEIPLRRSRQDEPDASSRPNPPHGAIAGPLVEENTAPAPRPVLEAPRALATPDLLLQLPGRCDLAQEAATRLVHDFGTARDGRHWGHFYEITHAAALRQIGTANLVNAYGQAMRPGVKRRGAKFWAAFKALEILDHPEWQEAGNG
jgi:hypothetical protein